MRQKEFEIFFFCLQAPHFCPVDKVCFEIGVFKRVHNRYRHAHTAVVRDIFGHDESAVDLAAVELDAVPLLDHFLCEFTELVEVLFLPPIMEHAFLVKVRAVVVESV